MTDSIRSSFAHSLSHLPRHAATLLALTALGCAQVQNDYVASPVDARGQILDAGSTQSGLVISGQEVTAFSSSHFGMVEVTFENKSSQWVRIPRLSLEFGNPAANALVFLPSGEDLTAWYRATVKRNDIRDTDEAATLGVLFLVGETLVATGGVSGERGVAVAGAGVAAAAGTVAVGDALSDGVENAERVQALPSTHLLAVPIAVPPGLFAKRWVVLNTRDHHTPCIRSMFIDYDVENQGHERVLLHFRPGGRSEWQSVACSRGSSSG